MQRTAKEIAVSKAVLWAWKKRRSLEKLDWDPESIAHHILSEVGRRPWGIACQRAVESELNLHFTQPSDDDEVEELDEK